MDCSAEKRCGPHKSDLALPTSGLCIAQFKAEYGRFPDAQTAADVAERTGSTLAPLTMDGKSVSNTRFDPNPYISRAVTLRVDLSVNSHPIDPTSGELLINGKPWLTTGEDTIWGTDITPRVATPEPK